MRERTHLFAGKLAVCPILVMVMEEGLKRTTFFTRIPTVKS